jgi:hypothetical protein
VVFFASAVEIRVRSDDIVRINNVRPASAL